MNTRLALAAFALAIAPVSILAAQNWNNEFVETERGFRVGKPDAPVQMISFVSYTCPHCAQFERESEAAIRMQYIHEGRAAVEVRSVLRNPIDLAATLAVQCGPAEKFYANHRTMFLAQDDWLAKARDASPAQMARWTSGTVPQRMRAIATDLDFYELMERRGYTHTEIDRCLTDEAAATALANNSAADGRDFAIPGTPSFAVNGHLVANAHSWQSLKPALDSPPQ